MATAFIFASCAFPTTFEDLWHVAAFCGVVLTITACILVLRKGSLRRFSSAFLIGATLVGSIWSFILADATSRNYLVCAGIPEASADLIRQAEESYHTLLIFQLVVTATVFLTVLLILINVLFFYFTSHNNHSF